VRVLLLLSFQLKKCRTTPHVIPPLILESLASWKNESLPPSEAAVARHWLLFADAELVRIGQEIRALESRRAALLAPSEVCRIALAPHKSLPTHVLRDIFRWATLDQAEITAIVRGHPERRLVICRVCSRWRSIALGMQELWSNVQISVIPHRRSLDVLDIWLSRSGQYPLSLEITDGHDHDFPQLLARYTHRIQRLSIAGGIPKISPVSMGILETLNVNAGHRVVPRASMTFLFGAPRLRSVTLRNFGTKNLEFLKSIGVPWRQLTELSIYETPVPIPQYYRILSECVALTTASLKIDQSQAVAPLQASPQIILVPSLRKLSLHGSSLSSFAAFLASFALPSLVDLGLSGGDDTCVYPVVTLPALKRLWIVGPNIGMVPEPVPWLRACPSASVVLLPSYELSNSLLTEIADGSLLPRLQMLVIGRCEVATLIATLFERQRSLDHSTIVEVGSYMGSPLRGRYAHDGARYVNLLGMPAVTE
jgi:hypothetical protein